MNPFVSIAAGRLGGRAATAKLSCLGAAIAVAIVASGCGGSVSASLVKELGAHSTALEKVYALYTSDALSDSSNRNLGDVNRALAKKDLNQATVGDLRRAQSEIRRRLDRIDRVVNKLRTANRALKKTPDPNFLGGLDDGLASQQFSTAYTAITEATERYTTADLAGVGVATGALERYLDFLEQWEEYADSKDTDGLLAAGKASDKALARLNRLDKRIKSRDDLSDKISPEVDRIAASAGDSSEISDLIVELQKQHPQSFLAKHLKPKK